MFQSITIGEKHKADLLDLGQVVEALIFFTETNLVVNRRTLPQLVNYFGIETFLSLQKDCGLKIYYSDNGLGVLTNKQSESAAYTPIWINVVGDSPSDVLLNIALEKYTKSGKSRRKIHTITNLIQKLSINASVIDFAIDIINKDPNSFLIQLLQVDLQMKQFNEIERSKILLNVERISDSDLCLITNEYSLKILEKLNYRFESIFQNLLDFVDKICVSSEIGADVNIQEHNDAKYFENFISEKLSVYMSEKKIKRRLL